MSTSISGDRSAPSGCSMALRAMPSTRGRVRCVMLFPPLIFGLFDTTPLSETSASPIALPALNDALEEEDVFKLDDPSKDAEEDEEDSAFDNEEDEGE